MHVYDKRRFFLFLAILALISGGLLAFRFGFAPEIGKYFASQPTAPSLTVVVLPTATVPTYTEEVARIGTGPGEVTILSLIVVSVIMLLYVGYAGSSAFWRSDAASYSKQARKSPPDFSS